MKLCKTKLKRFFKLTCVEYLAEEIKYMLHAFGWCFPISGQNLKVGDLKDNVIQALCLNMSVRCWHYIYTMSFLCICLPSSRKFYLKRKIMPFDRKKVL